MGDELVMERFRLLERIGVGGMGTVYRAFDERLQRQVAVKEIAGADPERVLREAQAAARLNHPGIVTLYELGERDGHALLVSELVPGETLAELHDCGELRDREVGEIALDLCDALDHAHRRGVVHRDLKPQNVIVGFDRKAGRRAKLMDFGIARIADAPNLTAAGEVLGTLAYMSPEQADGRAAGPASDVYSLALTVYECWSGTNPVRGRTPAETARRIGDWMPPLGDARPDLSTALTDVVDACLDPDPDLRPAVSELRATLVDETAALDPDLRVPAPDGGEEGRPGRKGRRRGVRVAVLVGLAVAITALAGPLGAAGAALVLAALSLPALLAGAPAAALAPLGAPLLAAAGAGSAAAVFGAAAPRPVERALIGVATWAWLLAGSLAFGLGPELGIAAPAPTGWSGDPSIAAESILAPLVGLDSLFGMAVFALAGVALGRVLALRHVSIALLGAMVWAAAVDGALSLVGNGALGGHPAGVVAASAIAVALEFALLRAERPLARAPARANGSRPLTT